jgi:FkbM family methyltransferase
LEPRGSSPKGDLKNVSAGDTVYDIGANIGYASLSLAKRVGPNGRVGAFEPVPRNVDLLRKCIEVNSLKTLNCWTARPPTSVASQQFESPRIRLLRVWFGIDIFPAPPKLTFRTVAIDDLVEACELGQPRLVRIDVEGAEGFVLQGMRRTIAASQPVLFVECLEAGRETAWIMLREMGYQCQSALTRKCVDAFEEYRH